MITLWLLTGLTAKQAEAQTAPPSGGGWVETDDQRRKRMQRDADERARELQAAEALKTVWRKSKGMEPPVVELAPVVMNHDDDAAILLLLAA